MRLAPLVLLVALLAGCGGGSGMEAGGAEGAAPPATVAAPEFVDGLEGFRGEPVVVNVWASWCPICRSEAAEYASFVAAHPETTFVGVDIRDARGDAERFLRQFRWTWPQIEDPDAVLAGELGFYGQPAVAVLGPDGEILASHVGGGTGEEWEALLAAAGVNPS